MQRHTEPSTAPHHVFAEHKHDFLRHHGPGALGLILAWIQDPKSVPSLRGAALKAIVDAYQAHPPVGVRRIPGPTAAKRALLAFDKLRGLAHAGRSVRETRRRRSRVPVGVRPRTTPVLVFPGTPAQRLDAQRHAMVKDTCLRVAGLRHGAPGGHTFLVTLTEDPRHVGYRVTIDQNRETYRGRYKGYPATEDHHQATVLKDWLSRVHRRGLGVVDGLPTLDASPLKEAPDGIELYEAVWVVQGRGYDARSVRGYIARSSGYTYHSNSAQGALRGLKHKLTQAAWQAELTIPLSNLAERVARHAGLRIQVADARAIGACEDGIRSWCASVGIDPDTNGEDIAVVFQAYQGKPRPEVRAAILYAIRKRGAKVQRPTLPQTVPQQPGVGNDATFDAAA